MPEQVSVGVCGNINSAKKLLQLHNVVIVVDGGSQSARGEEGSTTILCANDDVRLQFMSVFVDAAPMPNPLGEPFNRLVIAQPGQTVIDRLADIKPAEWEYVNYLYS